MIRRKVFGLLVQGKLFQVFLGHRDGGQQKQQREQIFLHGARVFSERVSVTHPSEPHTVVLDELLAEGVGFEPTVELPLLLISSQVPLTTQPPFRLLDIAGNLPL